MKEETQRKLFNILLKKGIKKFIGIPDSTIKYFIEEGLKKKKIIITTREEEAIGIATGMALSGEKSVVFMQNAGFANSLSTISSLVQLYHIPMILLIGWPVPISPSVRAAARRTYFVMSFKAAIRADTTCLAGPPTLP